MLDSEPGRMPAAGWGWGWGWGGGETGRQGECGPGRVPAGGVG